MKYADKYVHHVEDIPTGEHWAVITGSSVTIPGDERSRTAPGHGYPEHTENYIEYAVYLKEADFKEEMQRLGESAIKNRYGKSFRGIHVTETYTTTAAVFVETKANA